MKTPVAFNGVVSIEGPRLANDADHATELLTRVEVFFRSVWASRPRLG